MFQKARLATLHDIFVVSHTLDAHTSVMGGARGPIYTILDGNHRALALYMLYRELLDAHEAEKNGQETTGTRSNSSSSSKGQEIAGGTTHSSDAAGDGEEKLVFDVSINVFIGVGEAILNRPPSTVLSCSANIKTP